MNVTLIDKMGNDFSILKSARVSTGSEPSKGDLKDEGLMRYLWINEHLSPFESVEIQFLIECPIFIARQIMRHRTFSFNERSARYVEFNEFDYFVPEYFRKQGAKNHQGSGEVFEEDENRFIRNQYKGVIEETKIEYEGMIENGVAREMARMVMPVSIMTQFYMKGNLRNWFHFLELRLHEHAQEEVRVIANKILDIISSMLDLKWSVKVFREDLEIKYIMHDLKTKHKNDLSALRDKLEELK